MAKSVFIEGNDVVFKDNRLQMATGSNQITQKIRGILKIRKGQLVFNSTIGLDLKEVVSIEEKYISLERQKVAVIEALSQLSEIKTIDTIEVRKDKRNSYIDFTCTLQDGTVANGGVEIG